MTDSTPGPDGQHSSDDAALDPAEVESALAAFRGVLYSMHDDRIVAVGKKFFEILGGQAVAIRQEQPPWPLRWQVDWIETQLSLIEDQLTKLAVELPHELSAKLGETIVNDHSAELRARTAELFITLREGCNKILYRELPEAMKVREERRSRLDDEEGDDEDEVEGGEVTVGDKGVEPYEATGGWVAQLHGGQLIMLLSVLVPVSLALGFASFLAWAAGARLSMVIALSGAAAAAAWFAAASLWIWFGARRQGPGQRVPRS